MKIGEIFEAVVHGVKRAWKFITSDVWDIDIKSLAPKKGFAIRFVRVIHLVFKGFRDDECPLHASALTYSTLMSFVPVLAISLALARGLGGADAAKTKIQEGVNEWTQSFAAQTTVEMPVEVTTVVPEASGLEDATVHGNPGELATQINEMVETGFDKVENINFASLGGVGLILLLWMV
ncbi:MAG: YihY/virulence factor BrkB family protein, partial [Kiritimatiellae bacterium]|nr:YihY/virulence factor BrkB family protein [Kiritimatiellia bacterium]